MLEQEIKLSVASLDAVRRRLTERGGVLRHPAALEDNWVLDDAQGTLAGAGRLLRLRHFGGEHILTLKEAGHIEAGVKTRIEVETGVGDAERMMAILAALGFAPVRRYQKRRELWSFAAIDVALDETPIGSFVELEGAAEKLHAVARELQLDPARAVLGTYLDLWKAFRRSHPDASEDMIFC